MRVAKGASREMIVTHVICLALPAFVEHTTAPAPDSRLCNNHLARRLTEHNASQPIAILVCRLQLLVFIVTASFSALFAVVIPACVQRYCGER